MRVLLRNEAPPGGWEYTEPSTGYTMRTLALEDLFAQVESHRRANHIPYPPDWRDLLEEDICRQSKMHRHCGTPPPEPPPTERTLTAKDLGRFFRVVKSWFLKHGRRYEEPEVVERRAEICRTCPKNRRLTGCAGCLGAGAWVQELLPLERRTAVAGLENCTVCGCYLSLKVQIPLEANLAGSEGLEFPEHCWMRVEKAVDQQRE